MRKLIVIAAVLGTLWGGYWFIAASAMEKALVSWIGARQAEGWQAGYDSLNTRGFPNRFDTTVTQLRLSDPGTGLTWSAPWFQILSLSYKPHHVIAVWPDAQILRTPSQELSISAAKLQGSVIVEPTTALGLDRTSIVAERLELASTRGWSLSMDSAQFATRQTPTVENSYDVSLTAQGMRPGAALVQLLSAGGHLPETLDGVELRATLGFTAPWDRHAIEDARPQLTRLALDKAQASWGDLHLSLAGTLEVDSTGLPSGQIQITAKNWQKMLDTAVAAGLVDPRYQGTITGALEFMAGLSAPASDIETSLDFAGGQMRLGPIPLGPAPRLLLH